jgi:hypothetical protein
MDFGSEMAMLDICDDSARTLDDYRRTPMNNKINIWYIYSHAKSYGSKNCS